MSENPAPSLTLLIKLLKMTTSSSDAEALVAARKANAELKKFGGDWESLLRGKVTVIGDPFADLAKPDVGTVRPPRPSTPPRPAAPVFRCIDCNGAVPSSGMRCASCLSAWQDRQRRRNAAAQPKAAAPNGGFTRPGAAPQPQAKPQRPPAWSNAPKNVQLDELI